METRGSYLSTRPGFHWAVGPGRSAGHLSLQLSFCFKHFFAARNLVPLRQLNGTGQEWVLLLWSSEVGDSMDTMAQRSSLLNLSLSHEVRSLPHVLPSCCAASVGNESGMS